MTMSWSDGRRLTAVNGNITYAYNADGLRVEKVVDGISYRYLYDGGNVEGILDAGGNLLVRYTYDAWGNFTESVNASDPGDLAALALNPFRYRGYVYDFETGFYYLQSRYYDPETGRFISADSYVFTGQGFGGNNLFAYCLNDPIDYSDNFGSRAVPCTRFVTGGYSNPFASDGKGKSDDLLRKIVPFISDLPNKKNLNVHVSSYGTYHKSTQNKTKERGKFAWEIVLGVTAYFVPALALPIGFLCFVFLEWAEDIFSL